MPIEVERCSSIVSDRSMSIVLNEFALDELVPNTQVSTSASNEHDHGNTGHDNVHQDMIMSTPPQCTDALFSSGSPMDLDTSVDTDEVISPPIQMNASDQHEDFLHLNQVQQLMPSLKVT